MVPEGGTVVAGRLGREALAVAERVTAERGARLLLLGRDFDDPGVPLQPRGDFQRENFAVAVAAARGVPRAARSRARARRRAGGPDAGTPGGGGAAAADDSRRRAQPGGAAALAAALPDVVGDRRHGGSHVGPGRQGCVADAVDPAAELRCASSSRARPAAAPCRRRRSQSLGAAARRAGGASGAVAARRARECTRACGARRCGGRDRLHISAVRPGARLTQHARDARFRRLVVAVVILLFFALGYGLGRLLL